MSDTVQTRQVTLRRSPNGVTHAVRRNCITCGNGAHAEWPEVRSTLELAAGDRVTLPGGIVRTVSEVGPTNLRNSRNQTIYSVMYAEGCTSKWSGGNSALAETEWVLA